MPLFLALSPKGTKLLLDCSWLHHPVLGQISVSSYRPFHFASSSRLCKLFMQQNGDLSMALDPPKHGVAVILQEALEIGHCFSHSPSSCLSSCCMAQADLKQKVFVHRQAVIGMFATMIPSSTCRESSCHALLHFLVVDDDVCSTCLYIPWLLNTGGTLLQQMLHWVCS